MDGSEAGPSTSAASFSTSSRPTSESETNEETSKFHEMLLGALRELNLTQTAECLLRESPHLSRYRDISTAEIPASVGSKNGHSLLRIFTEFCASQNSTFGEGEFSKKILNQLESILTWGKPEQQKLFTRKRAQNQKLLYGHGKARPSDCEPVALDSFVVPNSDPTLNTRAYSSLETDQSEQQQSTSTVGLDATDGTLLGSPSRQIVPTVKPGEYHAKLRQKNASEIAETPEKNSSKLLSNSAVFSESFTVENRDESHPQTEYSQPTRGASVISNSGTRRRGAVNPPRKFTGASKQDKLVIWKDSSDAQIDEQHFQSLVEHADQLAKQAQILKDAAVMDTVEGVGDADILSGQWLDAFLDEIMQYPSVGDGNNIFERNNEGLVDSGPNQIPASDFQPMPESRTLHTPPSMAPHEVNKDDSANLPSSHTEQGAPIDFSALSTEQSCEQQTSTKRVLPVSEIMNKINTGVPESLGLERDINTNLSNSDVDGHIIEKSGHALGNPAEEVVQVAEFTPEPPARPLGADNRLDVPPSNNSLSAEARIEPSAADQAASSTAETGGRLPPSVPCSMKSDAIAKKEAEKFFSTLNKSTSRKRKRGSPENNLKWRRKAGNDVSDEKFRNRKRPQPQARPEARELPPKKQRKGNHRPPNLDCIETPAPMNHVAKDLFYDSDPQGSTKTKRKENLHKKHRQEAHEVTQPKNLADATDLATTEKITNVAVAGERKSTAKKGKEPPEELLKEKGANSTRLQQTVSETLISETVAVDLSDGGPKRNVGVAISSVVPVNEAVATRESLMENTSVSKHAESQTGGSQEQRPSLIEVEELRGKNEKEKQLDERKQKREEKRRERAKNEEEKQLAKEEGRPALLTTTIDSPSSSEFSEEDNDELSVIRDRIIDSKRLIYRGMAAAFQEHVVKVLRSATEKMEAAEQLRKATTSKSKPSEKSENLKNAMSSKADKTQSRVELVQQKRNSSQKTIEKLTKDDIVCSSKLDKKDGRKQSGRHSRSSSRNQTESSRRIDSKSTERSTNRDGGRAAREKRRDSSKSEQRAKIDIEDTKRNSKSVERKKSRKFRKEEVSSKKSPSMSEISRKRSKSQPKGVSQRGNSDLERIRAAWRLSSSDKNEGKNCTEKKRKKVEAKKGGSSPNDSEKRESGKTNKSPDPKRKGDGKSVREAEEVSPLARSSTDQAYKIPKIKAKETENIPKTKKEVPEETLCKETKYGLFEKEDKTSAEEDRTLQLRTNVESELKFNEGSNKISGDFVDSASAKPWDNGDTNTESLDYSIDESVLGESQMAERRRSTQSPALSESSGDSCVTVDTITSEKNGGNQDLEAEKMEVVSSPKAPFSVPKHLQGSFLDPKAPCVPELSPSPMKRPVHITPNLQDKASVVRNLLSLTKPTSASVPKPFSSESTLVNQSINRSIDNAGIQSTSTPIVAVKISRGKDIMRCRELHSDTVAEDEEETDEESSKEIEGNDSELRKLEKSMVENNGEEQENEVQRSDVGDKTEENGVMLNGEVHELTEGKENGRRESETNGSEFAEEREEDERDPNSEEDEEGWTQRNDLADDGESSNFSQLSAKSPVIGVEPESTDFNEDKTLEDQNKPQPHSLPPKVSESGRTDELLANSREQTEKVDIVEEIGSPEFSGEEEAAENRSIVARIIPIHSEDSNMAVSTDSVVNSNGPLAPTEGLGLLFGLIHNSSPSKTCGSLDNNSTNEKAEPVRKEFDRLFDHKEDQKRAKSFSPQKMHDGTKNPDRIRGNGAIDSKECHSSDVPEGFLEETNELFDKLEWGMKDEKSKKRKSVKKKKRKEKREKKHREVAQVTEIESSTVTEKSTSILRVSEPTAEKDSEAQEVSSSQTERPGKLSGENSGNQSAVNGWDTSTFIGDQSSKQLVIHESFDADPQGNKNGVLKSSEDQAERSRNSSLSSGECSPTPKNSPAVSAKQNGHSLENAGTRKIKRNLSSVLDALHGEKRK